MTHRLPQYDLLPHVEKIAVLRANGIGDFIFALPALQALRHAYPQAEIVLIGQEWHAKFLANRPGPIDRVVEAPVYPGVYERTGAVPDPAVQDRFFARMAAERFDLAIQMHGGGRNSNPFVRRLGARFAIGFRTPDAAPLDRWVPYVYFQPEYLRYLELVSLVGARPVTVEPEIAVLESDVAEARQAVPETGKPLVVLHPGATDPRRRWPPEKFAAVGRAVLDAGAQVAVIGTGNERDAVAATIAALGGAALDLYGRLSLGGLAGLLSQAALVVSNDSGPLHLAAAVGASTVGIYWCGNLINGGPVSRTRHRPSIAWRLHCPVCGRNCLEQECAHRASFVADVPTDEVIASALDLLRSHLAGATEAGRTPATSGARVP